MVKGRNLLVSLNAPAAANFISFHHRMVIAMHCRVEAS